MTMDQKTPGYTGDIAEQRLDPGQEYTRDIQEISYPEEQHNIWEDLFSGIFRPQFLEHICQQYKDGFEMLELESQQIPSLAYLNGRIQPRTGWRIERTAVRYTQADDWYLKFDQRVFLITDYLRSRDQIEFTPEPDIFHDIFGHLPYLALDFYARIEDKFAPAYLNATQDEKEVIKRLAWYSTEFGLVIQENRFKVFGAGIISSRAELANTIMEFYRLARANVIDYSREIFTQLQEQFDTHEDDLERIIAGVNELHQKGQMSSQNQGWNVVRALYDSLGISRAGYFGGDVILAPFDIEMIAAIPKTVYAFNPVFFVCESFDQMEHLLDSYLQPIADRA